MNRVLIVDDAIDLGRMLQDALKTMRPDLAVVVVPSAEEALLEATRFAVDLLVTDLRLPGMSGFELIQKIRLRRPQVKVIVMTGMVMDRRLDKEKKDLAPDVFLQKPVSATAFLTYVEQLLGAGTGPLPAAVAPGEIATLQTGAGAAAPADVLQEMAAVMPGLPAETPLVTRLPQAVPPGASSPSGEEEGLSGVLSRLRGALGALCTMLLDERGRSVAQAGDLPDPQIVNALIAPLMASLSAGQKIASIFGQEAGQSVQGYRGSAIDLLVAPVGPYIFLIWLRGGRSALRLAIAFEEALAAQLELSATLRAMGLQLPAAAPEPPGVERASAAWPETAPQTQPAEDLPPQEPDLAAFAALLTQKAVETPEGQDVDAFWENVAGQGNQDAQPGVLSFEQAQKLGLLPPEE